MMSNLYPIFRSFLQAGFECSTHKLRDGRRLDLLQSTGHDECVKQDYRRVQAFGIKTIRTGARWHVIEESRGQYNFDSLTRHLDVAADTGVEVLLDLLHFGWPDYTHVFSSTFVDDFGRYVRALARVAKRYPHCATMFAPVNEISFLSWAGGDVAAVNPYTMGRGRELKRILVNASLRASEVLLNELEYVRLISPEPVIHIVGNPAIPGDEAAAAMYSRAQFEAWDMLSGRVAPELGGRPEYLDIIGANFYDRNEWLHNSGTLSRSDPRYRPFHDILWEIWNRYRRPLFVAETGTENEGRADWFDYICDEVVLAHGAGVPVHGICLYPILNHPGWEDDRHCCNGLFDYCDADGHRETYWPLASAILNQQPRLQRSYRRTNDQQSRPDLLIPSAMGFRFSTATTFDEPFRA